METDFADGNEMRLLVTTHRRVFVHGKEDIVLDEGRGLYYGVTWSPDKIFIAARNWAERDRGTLILVYDEKLNLIAEDYLLEVSEVHQIFWWDGTVYICDTGHDRVLAWDGKGTRVVYEATQMMEDHSHINGIWGDGRGRGSGYRNSMPAGSGPLILIGTCSGRFR